MRLQYCRGHKLLSATKRRLLLNRLVEMTSGSFLERNFQALRNELLYTFPVLSGPSRLPFPIVLWLLRHTGDRSLREAFPELKLHRMKPKPSKVLSSFPSYPWEHGGYCPRLIHSPPGHHEPRHSGLRYSSQCDPLAAARHG